MAANDDTALEATRSRAHGDCVVCSGDHPGGLRLRFACDGEGGVEATFACDRIWEGYPDTVHGGIVSSLLDGAMTNCLFAAGQVALTAELTVRFREPLRVGTPAKVRAWIERSHPRLQTLAAEVVQDGRIKATAVAKFIRHPDFA